MTSTTRSSWCRPTAVADGARAMRREEDPGGHDLQRRLRRNRRGGPREQQEGWSTSPAPAACAWSARTASACSAARPICALSVNAVLEKTRHHARGRSRSCRSSGSMMGGLLSRGLGRGVGFSKLISVGNEADLGVGELADMLVDDPHTDAILLFMETHPRRRASRACRAPRLCRGQAGDRLQARPLRGRPGPRRIAHRRHGRCRRSRGRLFPRATACCAWTRWKRCSNCRRWSRASKPRARHRVAVMTTTGGGAACVVDRLGTYGRRCRRRRRDAVIAKLAQKNITHQQGAHHRPHAGRRQKGNLQRACSNALLASDHCDLVLAVAGSSAQFQPQIAVEPHHRSRTAATRRSRCFSRRTRRPRSNCWPTQASPASARRNPAPTRSAPGATGTPPRRATRRRRRAPRAAQGIARQARTPSNSMNTTPAACSRALGVPQAATAVMQDARGQRRTSSFPVVAKILSPDIAHKTDAGGVVLEHRRCRRAQDRRRATSSTRVGSEASAGKTQRHPRAAHGEAGWPRSSSASSAIRRSGRWWCSAWAACWPRFITTSRCGWRR